MGLIFIYELNENNPYTSDPSHMQKSPHSIRNGHFNGNHKRAFTSFYKSGLEKIKNNKTEFQVSAPVGCRCIYINLRLSHSLLPRITTPLQPNHCKLSSYPGALRCVLLHHRKIIWRFCPHLFLVPLWNKSETEKSSLSSVIHGNASFRHSFRFSSFSLTFYQSFQ